MEIKCYWHLKKAHIQQAMLGLVYWRFIPWNPSWLMTGFVEWRRYNPLKHPIRHQRFWSPTGCILTKAECRKTALGKTNISSPTPAPNSGVERVMSPLNITNKHMGWPWFSALKGWCLQPTKKGHRTLQIIPSFSNRFSNVAPWNDLLLPNASQAANHTRATGGWHFLFGKTFEWNSVVNIGELS